MDERLRFTARLLEGEKMALLCREFWISRVTGYKIYNRHKDSSIDGLNDRSPAAVRVLPNYWRQIPRQYLGSTSDDMNSPGAASAAVTSMIARAPVPWQLAPP